MNDAERDAWLREALRHAPDSDALPPSGISEAILSKARAAARAARPGPRRDDARRTTPPANAFAAFWSWLARPPVAAGFASVMAATLVGLMWWDGPIDETLPRPPAPRAKAPRSRRRLLAPVPAPAPATPPPTPEATAPARSPTRRRTQPRTTTRRPRTQRADARRRGCGPRRRAGACGGQAQDRISGEGKPLAGGSKERGTGAVPRGRAATRDGRGAQGARRSGDRCQERRRVTPSSRRRCDRPRCGGAVASADRSDAAGREPGSGRRRGSGRRQAPECVADGEGAAAPPVGRAQRRAPSATRATRTGVRRADAVAAAVAQAPAPFAASSSARSPNRPRGPTRRHAPTHPPAPTPRRRPAPPRPLRH